MRQMLDQRFTCPRCRQGTHFHVDVTATVHFCPTGSSLAGDYFAGPDAVCVCLACDYEARVVEFTTGAAVCRDEIANEVQS